MSGVLSYCHIHIYTYVHPLYMYLQPYIHHICTYLTRLKKPSKHPPKYALQPIKQLIKQVCYPPMNQQRWHTGKH
jgi:hypothetical protein